MKVWKKLLIVHSSSAIFIGIFGQPAFNENLHREKELSKGGRTYTKIVWPK